MRIQFAVFGFVMTSLSCLPSAFAGDWSGAHVGAHIGGGHGDFDWWFRPLPGGSPNNQADHDGVGLTGGVQAGYDWQFEAWVVGVSADISASHVQGSARCPGRSWSCESDAQWLGSVRGRIGYSVSDILLYTTGGVAASRLEAVSQNGFDRGELSKNHAGWVAGVGAEYAVSEAWSLKAEYLHYDFAERPYQKGSNPITVDTGFKLNTLTFGINRRF